MSFVPSFRVFSGRWSARGSPCLKHVIRRGINPGGQDPKNTLCSRISRMAGVTSARGCGYWLAEREAELSGLPASAPK